MDALGDRIKKYESACKQTLTSRVPVIVRVDGRAFHTYTKNLTKRDTRAYNSDFMEVMNDTALGLCREIQGAQVAYVQSDEISILVHGYKNLKSESWFGNEVQKMVSISASVASTVFTMNSDKIWGFIKPGNFDSRAFIVPENDVCNYFLWRQQDCTRNSVQMLARSLYSHKECYKKNIAELQEMCFQKSKNWNNEPTSFKRGRCIIKKPFLMRVGEFRDKWTVDNEIPVFSKDRQYINRLLETNEQNS